MKKSSAGIHLVVFALLASMALMAGCTSRDNKTAPRKNLQVAGNPLATNDQNENFILPKEPSLQDYFKFAEIRNPELKAAYYKWQAALQEKPQVTAPPNPQLSYGVFIKEADGYMGSKYMFDQKIPFPGMLAQSGRVASAQAEVAKKEFDAKRFELRAKIQRSYYEYLHLSKAIAITGENVKLVQYFVTLTETKLKSGQQDQASLLKAQVELDTLKNRLTSLEQRRSPMSAALNSAINRPIGELLPFPKDESLRLENPDEQALFKRLSIAAPKLAVMEQKVKAAAEMRKMSKYAGRPMFMFEAEYDDMKKTGMGERDEFMAQIGVEIPIWRAKARAAKQQANLEYAAMKAEQNAMENELAEKIAMLAFDLKDSYRRHELYNTSIIPKAEQSLKAAETAYTAGKIDFLDLLDSQRMLLMLRLEREESYRDYWQTYGELIALLGELPEKNIPSAKPASVVEPGNKTDKNNSIQGEKK